MRIVAAAVLVALLPGASLAQSPAAVPFREKAPDAGTSAGRTTTQDDAPARAENAAPARGARNVPNGQVAPPAAINSGVQVIAPERR